jgi:hypothetical protein
MASNNDLGTGRTQLNSQIVAGASNLAGPAMDLASGASALTAASNAIKSAALDKLLGPAAAFTGLLTGSLLVLRKIVRDSQILEKGLVRISNLQQIEGKFETLLKSAALAKQRIKELYDFTKNSPFRFEDVAEANRQLQALTFGAFSGAEAMKMVGDAAAATGQSMTEMSDRVGKLYAALASGRAIDKIAFQLQFTGIATEGLLGKLEQLEYAGAGFAEKWSEVEKVLARTENGMKNARAINDYQTKFEEATARMQKAFAEPFVDAQVKAIQTMTRATENLTPVLATIGADMAAVRAVFVDFKTRLVDVTFASSGMASALSVAWTAIKTLWIGVAAVTIANAMKGAAGAALFVKAANTAAAATLNLTAATGYWTAATTAATAGNLRYAATQALLAARAAIVAAATAINTAGMTAYRTATGMAAAMNYVLAASSVTVTGALGLAGKALGFVAGQIKSAVLALGLMGGLWTVVAGLALGLVALRRNAAEVAKRFDEMAEATAAADKKLKDLLATARTTDDWAKYISGATDELARLEQALSDVQTKLAERSAWEKFKGFFTGENIRLAGQEQGLKTQITNRRAERKASVNQLPFMGMGSREAEAYARELATLQALSDGMLEDRLQSADDDARVRLLEQEAARLDDVAKAARNARQASEEFDRREDKLTADFELSDARDTQSRTQAALGANASEDNDVLRRQRAEHEKMANSQHVRESNPGLDRAQDTAKEQIKLIDLAIAANNRMAAAEQAVADIRRNSQSELVRNNQLMADIVAKGASQTEEERKLLVSLQKQNVLLVEQMKTADELTQAAAARARELRRARDEQAVNAAGRAFDPAILQATADGNEGLVNELKLRQQLATIETQIMQARRDGLSVREQELTNERNMVVAAETRRRLDSQRRSDIERAANQALIRDDKKGAQAIQDAETLRQLQRDYVADGKTAAQATADFRTRLVAEAAGGRPSAAVSSLQSIGGGGSFAGGADPRLVAQERATRATELLGPRLDELIRLTRGPAG